MEYFTKKAHIYLCCHGKYNRVSGMTQLESYLDHARKSICVNADPLMYLILVRITSRINSSLEAMELLTC